MADPTPEEKVAALEARLAELEGRKGIVAWFASRVLYDGLTLPNEGDEKIMAYNSAKVHLVELTAILVIAVILLLVIIF